MHSIQSMESCQWFSWPTTKISNVIWGTEKSQDKASDLENTNQAEGNGCPHGRVHQTCVAITDTPWHGKWHQKSRFRQLSHIPQNNHWGRKIVFDVHGLQLHFFKRSLDTYTDVPKCRYLYFNPSLHYFA